MIMTLFFQECREILRSITYYIIVFCIAGFIISQMGSVDMIEKPVEGQESYVAKNSTNETIYGWKYSTNETIIMQSSLEQLLFELSLNQFVTYPFGFYKEIILSDSDLNKVYEILEEITVLHSQEIRVAVEQYVETEDMTAIENVKLKPNLKYEDFCKEFNKIDDILGGGSNYAEKSLYSNARVERTYEDALKDYESLINEDHISRAMARLFCDYMGIILGIMPVFLAVTRILKDKRAKATEVIYSKSSSSFAIMFSRYIAIIVMILIPVILCSINPMLQSMYIAHNNGSVIDYLAFIKNIFGWLLPTVLFTVSMGFLFTEITSGPIAILIQGFYWIMNIFLASSNLVGYVGMNLIPRFNSMGDYDRYQSIFSELVKNRIFYTCLGILLFVLSTVIYDFKRRGKWIQNGKIFKHHKSVS